MWRKGSYRKPCLLNFLPKNAKLFGRQNDFFCHFAVGDLHHTVDSVFDLEGTKAKDCFTPEELAKVGAPPDYPGTFISKPKRATAT